MAALGLLAQHPGSGYDLLRRFEKSMANVWPATQSQLYGELNKLSGAGLIEASAVGPRGRKEYRVTEAGRAELLRWITNPADDPPERSAGLLRIFLLDELPRDQARAHLLSLAHHSESEVERLKQLEGLDRLGRRRGHLWARSPRIRPALQRHAGPVGPRRRRATRQIIVASR